MHASAHQLAFHGAVVLLIGLLCGAPYGRAIDRGAPTHITNAWRLAHASLSIGAAVMLAVSGVLSAFAVAEPVRWLIAIALVVSSYAFCISLPLAAMVGHRGLSPGGPLSARLVYVGNSVGALASLVAAGMLVYAGLVSL